ncbi:DMT family transporter [Peribacillus butanolivorans]|uniref:DMT family transporter n=1 Tax=Peribacillus TaxID=2675229 RepID=UPI0006FC5B7B|nr:MULTISPECIES: multidrug efflux SMR transporter [unclassified Peribacillus]KQU16988.1 molecular chaperone [Bacillus sp. Leaf13]KRF55322.1 molecular chaperone [Bacillus sp. Soil768D1]MBK5445465.1 multidrug efflux SMR transporter [Peribacillus sp. TH24]MBK5459813.1 multidrug efflux SMR transporter [Peribacillus sp. TH27]MBK5481623.1 multidrug efflux SMR transporter [Peribacillus sp. TH16]
MAWGLLLIAGLEEVIATIAMKYMDGTRKKWPIYVMTIGFLLSFYCLSKAMQVLSAGVAYGVWTGIGSVGITLVGILWFKERFVFSQFISLGLILIGVIGLKMTSS